MYASTASKLSCQRSCNGGLLQAARMRSRVYISWPKRAYSLTLSRRGSYVGDREARTATIQIYSVAIESTLDLSSKWRQFSCWQHNKPVKAPVLLVQCWKYCTRIVSRGLIAHSASPRAVLASRHAARAIFPALHSRRCFN